jgi:hypothetical protein
MEEVASGEAYCRDPRGEVKDDDVCAKRWEVLDEGSDPQTE